MSLSELPALLRDDPAFTKLAGGSARVVAVSEAPRAFFLAGLARLTGRRPLVVGRADDGRGGAPGPRPPAVSPGRKGQHRAVPGLGDAALRAGVAGHRDHGAAAPGAVAAPVRGRRSRRSCPRSSWRRSGPWPSGWGRTSRTSCRSRSGRGRSSTGTGWRPSSWRPATGGSTRSRPGASSPSGARSSTSTRRPPTTPSASTCGATRSTGCRPSPWPTSGRRAISATRWRSSPAGSCSRPRRCGPGPRSSSRSSPGDGPSGSGCPRACCSTAWSRGCRG